MPEQNFKDFSKTSYTTRVIDTNDETLGTGVSRFVYSNVVLPGEYAFGYVYMDLSDSAHPEGASIPDIHIDFAEGIGRFEYVIGLDIDNLEQLANGDVTNPHEITVERPINIDTLCLATDEQMTYDSAYADNDSVQAECFQPGPCRHTMAVK